MPTPATKPAPEEIEDIELDKSGEIRKFKDMDLQAYVAAQVAKIPEGKHGGAVAYWSPAYGFRVAVVSKTEVTIKDTPVDLAFTVTATKPKKEPIGAQVGLSATW